MSLSQELINSFIKRLRNPEYHLDIDIGDAIITIDDINKRISLKMPTSKKGKNE